jgi:hypothetical protein
MRSRAALCSIALASLLSGCGPSIRPFLVPDPIDPRCAPGCKVECGDVAPLDVPLVDKDAVDTEAYLQALEVALVKADADLDTCEVRRASCAACIDRAAQGGAITPQE